MKILVLFCSVLFSVPALFAGTVITADAAAGVGGVQFMIDYVPLGAEDTEAPYSAVWWNEQATAGWHVISAHVTDAEGKVHSDTKPIFVRHGQ